LLRRLPDLDIVRVQDVGRSGTDDPGVLAWAADTGRIIITHDVTTLSRHAWERVSAGQPMPGVFAVGREVSVLQAIEDLVLVAECSLPGEWEGQVRLSPAFKIAGGAPGSARRERPMRTAM
jgi:hypothetical protein